MKIISPEKILEAVNDALGFEWSNDIRDLAVTDKAIAQAQLEADKIEMRQAWDAVTKVTKDYLERSKAVEAEHYKTQAESDRADWAEEELAKLREATENMVEITPEEAQALLGALVNESMARYGSVKTDIPIVIKLKKQIAKLKAGKDD